MITPKNISLRITATSPVSVGQNTTLTIDVYNLGSDATTSDIASVFVVGLGVSDAQPTLLFSDLILEPMSSDGMDELTLPVPMMAPGDFVFTAISGSVSDSVTVHVSSSVTYATNVCTIRQIQAFSDPEAASDDHFGAGVDIYGNYTIIAAPNTDSNKGAAYIYYHSDGIWNQQYVLTASDGAEYDYFGRSQYGGHAVSIKNDRVFVGAPDSSNGAVYVFDRSDTTWILNGKLEVGSASGFGYSIDTASDGNTILIGAPWESSVYIFRHIGSVWSDIQKINGNLGDWFDISLALSADGNTALIGASQHSYKRGCAYIFTNSDDTWIQETQLFANNGTSDDQFGYATALSEDGTVAVISAINQLSSGDILNSVYIFINSDGMWNQYQELSVPGTSSFGSSISMSNGIIVIGAPYDGSDAAEGEVFVFKQSSSNGLWQQVNRFSGLDSAADDTFGTSIDIFDNKIIVGAPGHNAAAGATYFFEINPPRLLSSIIAPLFIEANMSCSIQFDLYLSDLSHHAHIRFAMNDSDYYTSDFTMGTNTLSVTVPTFSSDVSDLHCSLFAVDAQNPTNSDEVDFVISLIPSSSDMNNFSPPSFKSLDSIMGSLFSQMFNSDSDRTIDSIMNSVMNFIMNSATVGIPDMTNFTSSFNFNPVYSNQNPFVSTGTRFDLNKFCQSNTMDPSAFNSFSSSILGASFIPIKNNSDTQTHFEISDLTINTSYPQSNNALTSNISGSFNIIKLASDTTAQVVFMLNGKIRHQSDYSSGLQNFSFNVPLERPGYSVYVVGAVNRQEHFVSNQRSGIILMPNLETAPSPFYIETYVQDSDTVNITVVEQAPGSASDIITIVCEQVSDSSYIFVSAFSDTIPVPGGFTVSSTIGNPGKYKFTATSTNGYTETTKVHQLGTQSKHQVTWHLLGSFLSMVFNLPTSFTSAFPGVSDYKTILSDMYLFAKQASFALELTIVEQSDVMPSDASILGEKKGVIAYADSDGTLLFVDKAGQFTLGLQNFMSSNVLIQYYDKTHGVLSDKIMTDNSGSVVINTITQLGTNLEIVNIHSDLQSDNSILFTINIRNNGPHGVSDAFLKFASSFGDDITQNIGIMNTNASDTISFAFYPSDLGDCTVGFDIDSITLVNTNTTSHILTIGPKLEITLAADQNTTTANSDVQLTATIINTGLIGMPSDTITLHSTCSLYPSDILPFIVTTLPPLLPNQLNTFTFSDFLPAGQFTWTAKTATTNRVKTAFTSNSVTINSYGTSYYGSTETHGADNNKNIDMVFDLPPQFIQEYSDHISSDILSFFSDIQAYATMHQPFVIGLKISDQVGVFNSDALILKGQQTVYVYPSDRLYLSNADFRLEISRNQQQQLYIFVYSDKTTSWTKSMNTLSRNTILKKVVHELVQATAAAASSSVVPIFFTAVFCLILLLGLFSTD